MRLCPRTLAVLLALAALGTAEEKKRQVTGPMQLEPGGPVETVTVDVHEVPVEPPSVAADEAALDDEELVVGVVVDGRAVAYPIRYLALTEVLDDRVGETPLAPSW